MIYQFTISIWYQIFLQFLLILFCLIVSSVHGGRDIAHYDVGAVVSSSGFIKGVETSHGLTGPKKSFPVPSRSLNSMQQNEYTKDALGQNFYLPLTEDGEGNFEVTVGLGTPIRYFTLIFDTGSDPSWIRCQTCESDCNDPQPVYNTFTSRTFSNVSCGGNDGCNFEVKYNDNSYSAGYYISDTLSFTPNDQLPGFVFGCAQNISRSFSGTSGLLGTGRGEKSLMTQFSSFRGLFCYCLPATDQGAKGFLVFGVLANEVCPVSRKLSLTANPNQDGSTQYFVKLIGITIGEQTLDTNSIMGSSVNVMIDSGTPITRLPPPVYAALKSEFNNIMSGFPFAEPWGILDTCYNLNGVQNWTPPEMVMHFENSVDVNLHPSAVIMKKGDSQSQVCLAFAGRSDASIIGNQQLREHSILLDLGEQNLGFGVARTGCTK